LNQYPTLNLVKIENSRKIEIKFSYVNVYFIIYFQLKWDLEKKWPFDSPILMSLLLGKFLFIFYHFYLYSKRWAASSWWRCWRLCRTWRCGRPTLTRSTRRSCWTWRSRWAWRRRRRRRPWIDPCRAPRGAPVLRPTAATRASPVSSATTRRWVAGPASSTASGASAMAMRTRATRRRASVWSVREILKVKSRLIHGRDGFCFFFLAYGVHLQGVHDKVAHFECE